MVKVLNKRTDKIPPDAIYVGRPSKWGNPFPVTDPLLPIGLSKQQRYQAVVDEYRRYLLNTPNLFDALPELRGKDLVCWCAPLPCHADVLLELSNSNCRMVRNEQEPTSVRKGNNEGKEEN